MKCNANLSLNTKLRSVDQYEYIMSNIKYRNSKCENGTASHYEQSMQNVNIKASYNAINPIT